MSDIVERLRARKEFGLNGSMWMILPEPDRDCHEAADEIEKGYAAMRENSELRIEIERLRGEVDRLRNVIQLQSPAQGH